MPMTLLGVYSMPGSMFDALWYLWDVTATLQCVTVLPYLTDAKDIEELAG